MGAFHPALSIVSWFRFDPQQRCLVLGRWSVHLARTWFLSWEMAFGVPNSPFFFRFAGGLYSVR